VADHGAMRASDADRERTVTRLRLAADAGRLLAEEFDERLGLALSARTYGQLDAIVADLPRECRVLERTLAQCAGRAVTFVRRRPRALLTTSAGGIAVAAVAASLVATGGGAAPAAVRHVRVSIPTAVDAATEHAEARCPSYPPPKSSPSCFFTGSLKAAEKAARQSRTGTVSLPLRVNRHP
jgi:hypothetical protein